MLFSETKYVTNYFDIMYGNITHCIFVTSDGSTCYLCEKSNIIISSSCEVYPKQEATITRVFETNNWVWQWKREKAEKVKK